MPAQAQPSDDPLANSGALSAASTLYAEDPLKNSGAFSTFSALGDGEKRAANNNDDGSEESQRPASDADTNVGLAAYHEGVTQGVVGDERERRSVRRKLDLYLLPIFCVTYGLLYLEKQSLNYGNVFGLQKGMHLKGDQYSWLGSVFYFSYLFFNYPAVAAGQRWPVNRVLFVSIFLWGTTVMTTAACRSFAGGMVNRFVLGGLEAGATPTMVLLTGSFWTKAEIPSRQLFWYSFQAWAGVIGGILSYAIGHIDGKLQEWEYIFLIFGALSVAWAFVVFFFLPHSPATVPYFSPKERLIAVQRVAANKNGISKDKSFKSYQAWEAARDPKTYLLFVMAVGAQIPNGLITSFSTVIIKGMGFSVLKTTLLGIPPNVLQVVALLTAGWICSRFRNMRVIVMTVGNVACLIASACLAYLPTEQKWGRLVSFWITPCQSVGFSLMLVMVSSNVGGTTKKGILAAVSYIGYCVGNIASPQFFHNSEAPRYDTAVRAMLAGYVLKTAAGIALGLYMWNENRRRDAKFAAEGRVLGEHDGEEEGMRDLTENENEYFRYVL